MGRRIATEDVGSSSLPRLMRRISAARYALPIHPLLQDVTALIVQGKVKPFGFFVFAHPKPTG